MATQRTWRTMYSPGTWVVLNGPKALVAAQPTSADIAERLSSAWADVVAATDLEFLVSRLMRWGIDVVPDLIVMVDDGALRCVVRGAVVVRDATTDAVVADGRGHTAWRSAVLDTLHVSVQLPGQPGVAGWRLPLAVGVVTAGNLDIDASDDARIDVGELAVPVLEPVVEGVPPEAVVEPESVPVAEAVAVGGLPLAVVPGIPLGVPGLGSDEVGVEAPLGDAAAPQTEVEGDVEPAEAETPDVEVGGVEGAVPEALAGDEPETPDVGLEAEQPGDACEAGGESGEAPEVETVQPGEDAITNEQLEGDAALESVVAEPESVVEGEAAPVVQELAVEPGEAGVDQPDPQLEPGTVEPEEGIAEPDGSVAEPEEGVAEPGGSVAEPGGSVAEPEEGVAERELSVAQPPEDADLSEASAEVADAGGEELESPAKDGVAESVEADVKLAEPDSESVEPPDGELPVPGDLTAAAEETSLKIGTAVAGVADVAPGELVQDVPGEEVDVPAEVSDVAATEVQLEAEEPEGAASLAVPAAEQDAELAEPATLEPEAPTDQAEAAPEVLPVVAGAGALATADVLFQKLIGGSHDQSPATDDHTSNHVEAAEADDTGIAAPVAPSEVVAAEPEAGTGIVEPVAPSEVVVAEPEAGTGIVEPVAPSEVVVAEPEADISAVEELSTQIPADALDQEGRFVREFVPTENIPIPAPVAGQGVAGVVNEPVPASEPALVVEPAPILAPADAAAPDLVVAEPSVAPVLEQVGVPMAVPAPEPSAVPMPEQVGVPVPEPVAVPAPEPAAVPWWHPHPKPAPVAEPEPPVSVPVVAPPVVDETPTINGSPLGAKELVFSDGQRLPVGGAILVGRAPQAYPGEEAQLVRVTSPNHDISRTHVRIELYDGAMWATDRESTNGTVVHNPDQAPITARPGEPVHVWVGGLIDIGDGVNIRVQ